MKREMKMHDLSYDVASRLLRADFATGQLFWKTRTPDQFASCKNPENSCFAWNGRHAEAEALANEGIGGYRQGSILSRQYTAHRVIWLLHTVHWPTGQIDHINGDKSDNRICNLRTVAQRENMKNRKRPSNNTSGVAGVYWHGKSQKWMAYITLNGVKKSIGYFSVFEDAVAERKAAEKKFGYHANHGRDSVLQIAAG